MGVGGVRVRGAARRIGALVPVAVALDAATGAARAGAGLGSQMHGLAGGAVFGGLSAFIILCLVFLRERRRWALRDRQQAEALDRLRGAHDRAEMLLASERQIIVTWDRQGEPVVEGHVGLVLDPTRAAAGARRVLAFGTWLPPEDAAALTAAVDALRARGTGFSLSLRGHADAIIEAEGRAVAGRALLRLRDATEDRREAIALRAERDAALARLTALSDLLDGMAQPVWQRDAAGRLAWVNAAYVHAVDGASRDEVVASGVELLDRPARESLAQAAGQVAGHAAERPAGQGGAGAGEAVLARRLSAIVSGNRRVLDVAEMPAGDGRVGIAIDVSELEHLQADLRRQRAANARTLDQLPTAVAMFDAGQRLIFHNAAYRQLWDLDQAFLDSGPLDGEILDRLRARRKLEEHADFRGWKQGVLASYRAAGASQTWWYLPDGRTLSVVADPNPQGGLTYLFDDVSDRMKLESRVNALMKVQAETLDNLKEPVAVFGADGRLTFANRAFVALWRLDPDMLGSRPRVEAVIGACRALAPAEEPWLDIRDAVVGLESRGGLSCRIETVDGTVLDCAAQPLLEGATLLTLIDVTASVNVERALTEKNDALETAAQLRDRFVHHVSYELRSPLTNIIGFTQLLGDDSVGTLNERQRDYFTHIMRSSAALLALINDILDLASIDAGSLALERASVDVRETVEAAARGIEDRLVESQVSLVLDVPEDVGSLDADGKRLRQVLFNLLSNAVGFSGAGQSVEVRARRTATDLVLSVRDYGLGIPAEIVAGVFDRFESHAAGGRQRGVGLGLSIVRSFVELHGGRVDLETAPGQGTCVTCTVPLVPPPSGPGAAGRAGPAARPADALLAPPAGQPEPGAGRLAR